MPCPNPIADPIADPGADPLDARRHRAIAAAIIAGRPEEARTAARLHLDFVEDTLREIEDDAARRRRSSRVAQRQHEKDLTP